MDDPIQVPNIFPKFDRDNHQDQSGRQRKKTAEKKEKKKKATFGWDSPTAPKKKDTDDQEGSLDIVT